MKQLRGQFAALLTSKAVCVGIISVCALVFVSLFNTAVLAQNDVGTIVGRVTDQTRAVIPNATVTVTNEGTGATRTVLSDASGRYTTPNLAPAQYTISVTAAGFQRFVSTHNTVASNSTVEIDAKMTAGAATQSVRLSNTAQVLQTQSAAVQGEVTGAQVRKLELNGRNPIYMTQFNPGVTSSTATLGDFNWTMNSGDSFNVNGARAQDVEYWIDGEPAVSTRDSGQITAGVNSDAVQEMQVLTADYSAEYGTGSGGEVRIVTKSGTRDFHGGLYEYLRNSAMIANTWSRNLTPATRFTAPFRYNNFGFDVGGPIWIPRSAVLSRTRDKVFFFLSDQWFRYRFVTTNTNAVPTLQMRMGDFSQLNTANPWYATGTLLGDPGSCYTSGSYVAANCTTYMAETGKNAIPGYMAPTAAAPGGSFTGTPALPNSPNGMAFIAAYPLPTPGYLSGTTNEEIAELYPENQRQGQYNLDILLTPNQHLEFRRSDNSFNEYAPLNGGFALVPLAWNRPNQTNALGWEWTIKPTMINELRAMVSDEDVYTPAGPPVPGQPNGYNRASLGWDFAYIYPNSAQPKSAENKIPTGALPIFTQILGTAYPSHSTGIIYALSDSLTYVWGNHTLKFGLYVNKMGENDGDQINMDTVPGGASNQNGTFTSSDTRTGYGPTTNVGLANQMLGLSDTYNEIGQRAFTVWRGWMWEEFAQDNWQATPKLHLDYGLRMTTVVPPHALWANADYFDPGSYSVANAPVVDPTTGLIDTSVSTDPFDGMVIPGFSSFPPSATYQNRVPAANPANWTGQPGAVLDFCEGEPCSNLFAPRQRKGFVNPSNELQPRFGFAYQLGPTSVIRGGAGRFTQEKRIVDNIFPGGNSPFQPTVTVASTRDNAAGTGPFQQIDNPSVGVIGTVVPPLTITTMATKLLPPSRYDWNVSYQQEFNPLHSTLSVAYVGAVGNHNWQVWDINQAQADATYTHPNVNLSALRPYQGYTSIQQMESVVNSKYQGLQIAWSSHFTDGSSIAVAYSLANTSDNGSNYRDIVPDTYYNLNLWGQADFNIKSALLINYDYLLPFFKGRHGFAGEVLRGWELSGADQMQTGTPSSVAYSTDYAGVGEQGSMSNAGQFWPHTVVPGRPKQFAGPTGGVGSPQWFHTTSSGAAVFTAPAQGTFTTQAGVRNLVNNPGLQDWNLSAIKTFPINESNAFEFHAEVYDFINHPNLGSANFNPTSSQFGEVTGKTGLVRTIQVGVKYRF